MMVPRQHRLSDSHFITRAETVSIEIKTRPAASSHAPQRGDRRWLAFAIPAFIVALVAAGPYVSFHYTRLPLNAQVPAHIVFLSLHALASGTALLIGPLQFIRRIRVDHPRVHRTIGSIYLLAVLMGSVMALASAIVSTSGWSAQVGFYLLDAFWLYTAVEAFRAVRGRHFATHRIWMIRNYSATFAAVVLRILLILQKTLAPVFHIPYRHDAAYDVSVWGSIALSLLVAELFIVERSMRPVLPDALITSVPPGHIGV